MNGIFQIVGFQRVGWFDKITAKWSENFLDWRSNIGT
jgi:hypothetical protein